jgi:hypothetical protein
MSRTLHDLETVGMSGKTIPDLPVEHAGETQRMDQLVKEVPAYGSVEADVFLAQPAKPWRDTGGNIRTDHVRPPGWIWTEGGWMHRKMTFDGLLDWHNYSAVNLGVARLREQLLTPPEAWTERRAGFKRPTKAHDDDAAAAS